MKLEIHSVKIKLGLKKPGPAEKDKWKSINISYLCIGLIVLYVKPSGYSVIFSLFFLACPSGCLVCDNAAVNCEVCKTGYYKDAAANCIGKHFFPILHLRQFFMYNLGLPVVQWLYCGTEDREVIGLNHGWLTEYRVNL